MIYPVILAGGSGTRLWPLSRAGYPKQLLALTGEKTMLQQTLERAVSLHDVKAPLIICNDNHRFIVKEQAEQIKIHNSTIILEPSGRNTAPAIALAALQLLQTDSEAIMLVLSADHVIRNATAFASAVEKAIEAAKKGYLVTFGIQPQSPETGYGYIKSDGTKEVSPGVYAIEAFVEKPNSETAQSYLDEGNYTWNSGMFVLGAKEYLRELSAQRPDILNAVETSFAAKRSDLGFIRSEESAFSACPSESIDYAIMQGTKMGAVIPVDLGWSDVGSWGSLWEISDKDVSGNVMQGDVFISDTHNSYVRSEHRQVSVIGLDNIVVVETKDAVLITHRDQTQEVRRAVKHFEENGRSEHITHMRVYRPWGWYEAMDEGERFQVKRIMVKPGEKLSLQMHYHRAEHWIVVSGTAKVTIGENESIVSENQSTYIPLGTLHRLENAGKVELMLIEVQSGSYLGEDDIVRFQDNYGR